MRQVKHKYRRWYGVYKRTATEDSKVLYLTPAMPFPVAGKICCGFGQRHGMELRMLRDASNIKANRSRTP